MDNYENTIQQFNQNFLNIIKINNECFTNKTTLNQNLSVMKEKHTKINKNNIDNERNISGEIKFKLSISFNLLHIHI